MMDAAGKHHCVRIAFLFAVVSVVGAGALMANRQAKIQRADVLASELITALPDAVPSALANLRPVQKLAAERLRRQMDDSDAHPTHRLRAAFALVDLDGASVDFLFDAVSTTPERECSNLLQALKSLGGGAIPELRQRFNSTADSKQKARLAIVILYLGDAQPASDLLAVGGDPIDRTTLIQTGAGWHSDLRILTEAMRSNDAPSFAQDCVQCWVRWTTNHWFRNNGSR